MFGHCVSLFLNLLGPLLETWKRIKQYKVGNKYNFDSNVTLDNTLNPKLMQDFTSLLHSNNKNLTY